MIKKLHLKTMLLLCAMILGIGSAWAQEVTIASFSNAANEGWTINNAEYATAGGGYYKLTSSDASIVTPSINWTEYTDITIIISARKFGGPDTTQGKIAVSQGEVELATYSPSGTSIAASSALSISPTDGVITISCPGASSNKGCGVQSIVIKAKDPSGGDLQTVATPTFSPAGGTYAEVKNVTISTETENATIYYTTNGTDPTISSNVYSSAISVSKTTTIKAMAVKEGMNNSAVATATYTINLPYSGDGYVRINSLSDLTDGAKVIIAARHNTTANAYYAMTAAATGKPTGVAFESQSTDKGEELPSAILDNENTYYWTVGVTSDGYTFTNASGKSLGYSSGTDFATDGDNTAWTITKATSGNSAMVKGYEGFNITNKNNSGRGVALNQAHNFGPYATSNNTSNLYNFYLDIFVEGATPVIVPSISANNVNIAYDATEGSIAYTLTNGVEGGNLTATTTAEWLTLGTIGETAPFTCSANTETAERTATVTLTYTYGDNETVTKEVNVTQAAAPAPAVVYTTIPELVAAASTETEVQVTFDNWVVSGVSTNGKNVFVTDNGGHGFVIYYSSDMSSTFSAGDILSGNAVACSLKLFNGFAELVNLDASDLTITAGGIVSEADIALAELAGVNTGALVSYENLTCSVDNNKYYLTDGTTTLQVYNSLFAFEALEDGKTYNITGIYQQYNNTKEILPRSADDIEEVTAPTVEYTLTVTASDNVEIFTFVGGTAYEGVEGSTTQQVSNGTEVGLSVSAAEGYELKLLVDGTDVTSQLDDTGYYSFTMPTHNVTVSATAVAPEETIGTFVKVTSTDDITSGQYLIVCEDGGVAFDGSLATLDAENNTIEVTIEDETIAATATNALSVFNIDVTAGTLQSASGQYIGVSSNKNGLNTSDDATTYTHSFSIDEFEDADIAAVFEGSTMTLRYNSASDQARFRYYKNGQKAIQLYKFVADEEGATVTITDAGYATYCSEKDLDFSNTGLTAYKAAIADTEVSFSEVKQVPAGQGVLLKGAKGTYSVPVAANAAALTGNALIGVTEQTTVNESGIFVLLNGDSGVGFYKTTANAFTVGAHTAYIPALPNSSRDFIAVDETTAIKAVESQQQDGEIYNLAGQRVAKAQKGLYIIGGKKVVIK